MNKFIVVLAVAVAVLAPARAGAGYLSAAHTGGRYTLPALPTLAADYYEGQAVAAGWDIGKDLGFGLVYERTVRFPAMVVIMENRGFVFERYFAGGRASIGAGFGMITRRGPGVNNQLCPTFDILGRAAILQFRNASLEAQLGFRQMIVRGTGTFYAPRLGFGVRGII